MRVLILLLLIPLVLLMAIKAPETVGHFVAGVVIVGAKLLNAVATFLNDVIAGH
jgi:hypothetical protein